MMSLKHFKTFPLLTRGRRLVRQTAFLGQVLHFVADVVREKTTVLSVVEMEVSSSRLHIELSFLDILPSDTTFCSVV